MQEQQAYAQVSSFRQIDPSLTEIRPGFHAYLASYRAFLDVLVTGNPSSFDDFEEYARQAEEHIPEDASHLHRYLRAEIGVQRAFVKLKEGAELSAVWWLRKSYRDVDDYINEDPENILFRRTWGLLQILVGAVPDNYQWVPRLFGVEGSIEEGRKLLLSIPESHWLYPESRAVVSLADSYLLDESDRAVKNFGQLVKENSNNALFSYLYMALLLRDHHAQEAIDHFKAHRSPLHLTYYLAGNAYLQAAQYENAIHWFGQFENEYSGNDFRKDTAYKLFLAYFLSDRSEEARAHFDRIHVVGATNTESDRYAAGMYEKGYPNKELMTIRLATDGGFYHRAEEIIQSLTTKDFGVEADRVEFIYRKARLYHFTGRSEKAINTYLETIEQQGSNRWYFAPNSCLQLGYLYLEKGQRPAAQEYFRKTFDYRGYEYKKGIDRKAHSALVTYF